MFALDLFSTNFSYLFVKELLPLSLYQKRSPLSQQAQSLKDKVTQIAKDMGISGSFGFIEHEDRSMRFSVRGLGVGPFRRGIFVDDVHLKKATQDELSFLMKHELSHIKFNHGLKIVCLKIIVATICRIALHRFFPILSKMPFSKYIGVPLSLLLPITPGSIISNIFSTLVFLPLIRKNEKDADLEALKYCSKEEKEAAVNYFQKLYDNKQLNDKKYGLCFLDLDLLHPPLTERIKYIRNSI